MRMPLLCREKGLIAVADGIGGFEAGELPVDWRLKFWTGKFRNHPILQLNHSPMQSSVPIG